MAKSLTPRLKKLLTEADCYFERQGKGDHEIWFSPLTQRRFVGDNVLGNKNVSNDNSRNQNISGGTINNSGAGAFSLGDINGTVANTIAQLPDSSNPNEPGIKDLLTQLQQAVDDPNLADDEKQETLEQIKILATAGQNPQAETMQRKAKRAVDFLEVIAQGVEPATKLAKTCAKVLPKILLFFGL